MKTVANFPALRAAVHNRGPAPIEFLDILVSVIKGLPDEVFSDTYRSTTEPDVFDFLKDEMNRLIDPAFEPTYRRKAFMCEVLRVLGGFESSWNWREGRDVTNPSSNTPATEEAGIFQCSANSMNFDPSLKECLDRHFGGPGRASVGSQNDISRRFISYTKDSPSFAIEYCARLLRFTVRHHGPLVRREIVPWLRADCVQAFFELLTQTNTITPMPTSPVSKLIRIIVDPGHGGADSGAVGEFQGRLFTEKDIVLQVANNLVKRLRDDRRFETFMTRTDDTFIPLLDRAGKANVAGADLISIHANAGGGTGFECFTSLGQTQSDQWAEKCLAAYAAMFPGFTGRYDTQDGDKDKEAKFTVLAKTLNRAILFELGFMDRPSDLGRMVDQTFAGRAAEALYVGTCRFYGIEPEPIPGSEPDKEDPVTAPVEGNPPVESLAGAFLEGYEAAIQQLQIRVDSTGGVMKKIFAGQQAMSDLPDYYRAWVGAHDAKEFLSHPEVRKAAGLPG